MTRVDIIAAMERRLDNKASKIYIGRILAEEILRELKGEAGEEFQKAD